MPAPTTTRLDHLIARHRDRAVADDKDFKLRTLERSATRYTSCFTGQASAST
jgi:hypothetical protein